jgi:ribonuclease P protein component
LKPRFAFTAEQRVKKKTDFERLQRSAKKHHTKNFLLLISKGATACSRLGLTVTTKVAPQAVARNRIKRRVREAFRQHQHDFVGAFDIVVIARQNAQECSFDEVKKQIIGTLRQHGYLRLYRPQV